MNRKKELFKNTIVIGIGNVFSKAISFLLVPLFTLWLSTQQYGDYDLLYSYVSLVVPIITLQLEQAILRYTLDDKSRGPKYFHVCLSIVALNSLAITIIFVGICNFNYHTAFAFCSISYALEIYCTEYLRGCNELKFYSLMNVICGICTILFSFLFVRILNFGVNGLLSAFGCSYLATAVLIFLKKRLYSGILSDLSSDFGSTLRILLLYSLPLLPNAISWWITNVSDRTMIRIFGGSHYNGLYAVSCKIPSLITVFYGIFNLAWQQSAILSSKDDLAQRKAFYTGIFKQLFIFLFSSGIVIIAATPILYRLFLDVRYIDGMSVVPILIWATTLLNLAQYLGGILLGQKDTKINETTTVIAAIVNLLIDILFINKIGLYAAAISTLASYFVMLILRLIKLKDFFNIKRVAVFVLHGSAALTLSSIIMLNMKSIVYQWMFLTASIILFLFINKTSILNVVNKIKEK